jgi:hypothetical protein
MFLVDQINAKSKKTLNLAAFIQRINTPNRSCYINNMVSHRCNINVLVSHKRRARTRGQNPLVM